MIAPGKPLRMASRTAEGGPSGCAGGASASEFRYWVSSDTASGLVPEPLGRYRSNLCTAMRSTASPQPDKKVQPTSTMRPVKVQSAPWARRGRRRAVSRGTWEWARRRRCPRHRRLRTDDVLEHSLDDALLQHDDVHGGVQAQARGARLLSNEGNDHALASAGGGVSRGVGRAQGGSERAIHKP